MNIRFTESAHADYLYWKKKNPKKALKIKSLITSISKDPFSGSGKPEPLKYDLQGCWSRRIDRTHHLVYMIDDEGIVSISCRYHY